MKWMGCLLFCVSWAAHAQTHQTLHERWPNDIREVTQCVSNSLADGRLLMGTTGFGSSATATDVLEVDSVGHVVQTLTLRRPSGAGDFELVNVRQDGAGYIACGHTMHAGHRRPAVVKLTANLDVQAALVYALTATSPQGTAPTAGVALDITPDGAGGYVFCGFAGDSTLLEPLGSAQRQALAVRLNGALEVTWATQVDSPNPPGAEDYDGFSHVLALPSGHVFLSGSSNTQDCLQEASAVMLNGANGNLMWGRQLARSVAGAHHAFSGDAVFDVTDQHVHQVVNHSWDHTWAFTTWDLQGNLIENQTWQSNYPDDNWQGMTLLRSVNHPNRWTVAGQHRVGQWQGEAGLAFFGTTPFLTEFDESGEVYFSREYLIPQNNATLLSPSSVLSTFVDQHGRFRAPTVALPMLQGSQLGYSTHGYRSDDASTALGVESVLTNGIGLSPCGDQPVFTSLAQVSLEVEQTLVAGNALQASPLVLPLVVSTPEWTSSTCGTEVPASECMDTMAPSMVITAGTAGEGCESGCLALFDGLTPPGYDPNVHCLKLSFGDGESIQFTGAPPVPLLHCYDQPLQWEGPGDLPVACLEVVCCESQISIAQHCIEVNLPCLGSPTEPFDPVDPAEVNECGIADGALFGLGIEVFGSSVSPNGVVCCEVAICPEMPAGVAVDLNELCVRMDFGNGEVVDGLPFQQCQVRCLELGSNTITAQATCCTDPEGFAMQAMAVHTCVTQEVCPGDLNGDGVVGVSDLLGLLSVFGASCD